MASKKVNKNKKPIIGSIESIIPKNLKLNKIKINPGSVIEDTKNKIENIYTNILNKFYHFLKNRLILGPT